MRKSTKISNLDRRQLLSRFLATASVIAAASTFLLSAKSSLGASQSFYGTEQISSLSTDPTKPVTRGYIVPSATPITGGAKLAVDLYYTQVNSPVSLYLEMAVNDGKGNVRVIGLQTLSDKVIDNPTLFHSRREFDLNYDAINQELAKSAPNAGLKVGPGTPLFVYAQFHLNGGGYHQWGSVGRGGIVFMPEDGSASATSGSASTTATRRATELDIALPISPNMIAKYRDPKASGTLKPGGQIRSRLETEGKFQIPDHQSDALKKELFELANDPAKAAKVLGADWTIQAQLRYMQKDASGNLLKDANGYPIPDPMVDTYYDNDRYDAAKHDMAIRYRWTAGNNTGSWNFKPGLTHAHDSGLVDRIEYGVDATDDKPESIAQFADSDDPANPFRVMKEVIPGAKPSDFLKPAVKVSDNRYKFTLQHKNGLNIEVSLDEVTTEALRAAGKTSKYVQMEMDVEHLATQSQNIASSVGNLGHEDLTDSATQSFMNQLDSTAFMDGRPVMHDLRDLDAGSPLKQQHASDFKLASDVTIALREHLLGKGWTPGAQKYAYGAYALDLVAEKEASPSVKKIVKLEKERKAAAAATAKSSATSKKAAAGAVGLCATVFD